MYLLNKCYNKILFILLFTASVTFAKGQTDTEFPKGFIMYGKLHSGMIENFTNAPEMFTGGIQLAPQYTVVPHVLRIGAVAGGFFSNRKIQGEFGPSVSLKLKTINANLENAKVGSIANINLLIEHLWGTSQQRLIGGGIIMDTGNLISIGLTAHRDYNLNDWWFQTQIGIRLTKKHKNTVI